MREAALKIAATVVVLTKNEAKNIRRAVRSALEFDQVLVIDSSSHDDTVAIARGEGADVVNFVWDGKYPKKKEWALGQVRNDWVVYLDADEYFTPQLTVEIRAVLDMEGVSAFEVPLRYHWMGRELRHGHRVTKRIGMRRTKCYWPRPNDLVVKNMWEVEGHYQPQVRSGRTLVLSNTLGHHDEDGLYEYFSRHNRYSDWEAHMLHSGDTASLQSRSRLGRLAARMPAKPFFFFVYSYFVRGGFQDGRAGLTYAIALSFYYWQIKLKIQELKQMESPK